MRPLGKTQRALIRALQRHGGVWHSGSAWTWDNRSKTVALMDSLARRGLVDVSEIKCGTLYPITRKIYTLKASVLEQAREDA